MVVSCSACGEQYGVTEDVTFHKFPADKERREKWLAAVQRDEWTPAKRSMLCSKHFSPDKFVYKISGDKIRRYLMADTVPTIFDRTKRNSKKGPPPQLGLKNKAPSSPITPPATQSLVDSKPVLSQSRETLLTSSDSTHSLNLEILAATSVASEPFPMSSSPESSQLDRDDPELVETSAGISPPVAGTSSDLSVQTKSQKRRQSSESANERVECPAFPKRVRQVYPGDFRRLNYNDGLEVSKSWTVQSNYVKKMRNKMKALRQQNKRLEKRVTDLTSVVEFLKSRIVAENSEAVESHGPSDSPAASHSIPESDRVRRLPNPLRDHNYISVTEEFIYSP